MPRFCRSLLLVSLVFAPLLAWAAGPVGVPEGALPKQSIYRIPPLLLRDQQGRVFPFASLRGEPRLVGMFYGSCKMVCPLEIEAIQQIEHAVVAAGARPVPAVLVSFDPAHDDQAMLRDIAAEHHVQAPLFRLTRPEQGDEGMLAGVLGIAYRPLPDGSFSHNVVVALLDAQGRIVATTDTTGVSDTAFIKAIVKQGADHPGTL